MMHEHDEQTRHSRQNACKTERMWTMRRVHDDLFALQTIVGQSGGDGPKAPSPPRPYASLSLDRSSSRQRKCTSASPSANDLGTVDTHYPHRRVGKECGHSRSA